VAPGGDVGRLGAQPVGNGDLADRIAHDFFDFDQALFSFCLRPTWT
jgi:hypothetical protein